MRPAPAVIFQLETPRFLHRGIETLTRAIAPTLGPSARPVAVARDGQPPELLDNGAVIARRMLQLPNRSDDVGAMFLRNLLWRVHEQAGDGTATACVIFDAVFTQGVRYLAAGGDAMLLREAIRKQSHLVLSSLERMATPASEADDLERIANSMCHDRDIASTIARIHTDLGQHARVEIRNDRLAECEVQWIPGSWWKTDIHSHRLLNDTIARRFDIERAALLVSDLDVKDPMALRRTVDLARASGAGGLVIVCNRISDACLTTLLSYRAETQFDAIAVRTPFASQADQMTWMREFGLLTGSRSLHHAANDSLDTLRAEDFGFARRAWADIRYFGIVCGRTRAVELRGHVRELRRAHDETRDPETRTSLSSRIATLTGSAARMTVAEPTIDNAETREQLAERTARAVRRTMTEGVVDGGGRAYLAARKSVEPYDRMDETHRAAASILTCALEAPFRQIAKNAGLNPELELERAISKPNSVKDSLATLTTAWQVAVEGAALALTIDTIIHRANPEESMVP